MQYKVLPGELSGVTDNCSGIGSRAVALIRQSNSPIESSVSMSADW